MKERKIVSKIVSNIQERVIPFRQVRLGQTFVFVNPPEKFKHLKNKIYIRMAGDRIQELSDDNVRFETPCFGDCNLVSIYAEVIELALT